jgi:hypothetical protein
MAREWAPLMWSGAWQHRIGGSALMWAAVPAAEQGAQRPLPYPITKATGRVEPSLLVTAAAWGITVVLLLYGWAAGEFAVSLVSPWAPLEGFELIATD